MEKPLIYYAVSVFLGCMSTLLFFNNVLLGAVFTASFLIVIFVNEQNKSFIIIAIFFVLGMFSFYSYFNINIPNEIKVRIVKQEKYYCFGEYKGRNIFIIGKTKELKEGIKVKIKGDFKKEKTYERGFVGNFKVKKVENKEKDIIYKLYKFKKLSYDKFKQYLGEDRTAILMSLCFGETKYISNSNKDILKKLGVIHAVSVSGLHMAIIYKVLEKTLGLTLAIPISFVYVIFTGMKSSAIRAFIMILILKFSKKFSRKYHSLSSLSLAAIIILLGKPFYILDIGFMLSFLSTLGILLYNKRMGRLLYKLPKRINSALSITLSAQIYTFPYICFTLKNFGLGFILGNLILVPLYSPVVLLGNLGLVLINIPFIFKLVNKILYVFLIAVEGAHYLLENITPEIIYLQEFQGICFIIIYLSYILYKHGYKNCKYIPLSCILFLILFNYSFFPRIDFYKEKDYTVTIIKYRFNTTMICNYEIGSSKKILKIKESLRPDRVISNIKEHKKISLEKDLRLYLLTYSNEDYKDYSIILKSKWSNIIFSQTPIKIKSLENKYAIINLKEESYDGNLNKCYIVFLNKVLCLN